MVTHQKKRGRQRLLTDDQELEVCRRYFGTNPNDGESAAFLSRYFTALIGKRITGSAIRSIAVRVRDAQPK